MLQLDLIDATGETPGDEGTAPEPITKEPAPVTMDTYRPKRPTTLNLFPQVPRTQVSTWGGERAGRGRARRGWSADTGLRPPSPVPTTNLEDACPALSPCSLNLTLLPFLDASLEGQNVRLVQVGLVVCQWQLPTRSSGGHILSGAVRACALCPQNYCRGFDSSGNL